MRARHRAPRRRARTVGEHGSPRLGLVALSLSGVAVATLAAALMSGFAGAAETSSADTTNDPGQNQSPAEGRPGIPQPAVRPATTWYSDWSSWGSSGTNCDPMALRWC
jgi:hypothetical protein